MKRIYRYTALYCLIFTGLVFSCLAGPTRASEPRKPFILTTTAELADITRSIVANQARVKSIATGNEDPHFLSARPGYILQAREADAWIRVGMELEIGWEGPILTGSRNPKIQEGAPGHIDVSEDVWVLDIPKGRVTRDMGDVHPYGNPHYWLDPLNGRIMAHTIAKRLGVLFPELADGFQKNLTAFERQLDISMFGEARVKQYTGEDLWKLLLEEKPLPAGEPDGTDKDSQGWAKDLMPCQGRSIVTYHRSWIYFARRFGLEVAMELEPKPGIPPGSKHLSQVIDTVRSRGIDVILQEPFYSRKAADFVARATNAEVIVCPNTVDGSPEADSYVKLISTVVDKLAQAMNP